MDTRDMQETPLEARDSASGRYAPPELIALGRAEDLTMGSIDKNLPELWAPFLFFC